MPSKDLPDQLIIGVTNLSNCGHVLLGICQSDTMAEKNKTATVAENGKKTTTVALFCDSVDRALSSSFNFNLSRSYQR